MFNNSEKKRNNFKNNDFFDICALLITYSLYKKQATEEAIEMKKL